MTCPNPCAYKSLVQKQNLEIVEWRDRYVALFERSKKKEKYVQHLPHCRPYEKQGCTCGYDKIIGVQS